MLLKVNRNLKYVCYDSVHKDDRCFLLIRTFLCLASVLINMTSVKFFNCTLVAVVNIFNPFCTMILAAIFLREKLACYKIVQLLIALGGAALLILFTPQPQSGNGEPSAAADSPVDPMLVFMYVCLFANPMFISSSNKLVSRKARNLNYNVISISTSTAGIVFFTAICYAVGDGLGSWQQYNLLDWVWLCSLSLSFVLHETFQFLSLQNWEASQLQPYAFVTPVAQTVLDLVVF